SSPNSLYNMGYLHFSPNLKLLSNWEMLFHIPFLMKKGFDKEDMLNLYNYLFNQFRIYRAIEYPEYVDPNDKYFSPINIQGGFCRVIPNASKKRKKGHDIKSWKPSKEVYSNSRLDYLSKIYRSKRIDIDNEG